MKTLAGTILLVAVLGLFAFTNPKMDSYVQFVRGEAVRAQAARGQQDDGLFAALFKLYGTLYFDSAIDRTIIEATVRKDYVFFSLYDTKGTGAGGQHARFLGILNNFFPQSGQLLFDSKTKEIEPDPFSRMQDQIMALAKACDAATQAQEKYAKHRKPIEDLRAQLGQVARGTLSSVEIAKETYTFTPPQIDVVVMDDKERMVPVAVGMRPNGGDYFRVLMVKGTLMMIDRTDNMTVKPLTDKDLGFKDTKEPRELKWGAFCAPGGAGVTSVSLNPICATLTENPRDPATQKAFCNAVTAEAKAINDGTATPSEEQKPSAPPKAQCDWWSRVRGNCSPESATAPAAAAPPTTLNVPREAFPAAAIAVTAHWQITAAPLTAGPMRHVTYNLQTRPTA